MAAINPTAFDALAEAYDDDFTHSVLGRLLRPRVWDMLAQHFTVGQHVLELTCGTGEDALWLAQRGVHVTATDGSAEMVEKAKAKAGEQGSRGVGEQTSRRNWSTKRSFVEAEESRGAGEQRGRGAEGQSSEEATRSGRGRVEVEQVSLQQVVGGYFGGRRSVACPEPAEWVGGRFDGVFSNFGGLNTIGEWRSLAAALAEIVKPGGTVILVPMGPFCPWEILWYLAHGQPKQALRRFARDGVSAKIGDSMIPIWYPSAARLRADFGPWFRHYCTESLELWLPPSYLDQWVNKWPGLFRWLNRFEQATARLTGGWGDHYIIVFKRN